MLKRLFMDIYGDQVGHAPAHPAVEYLSQTYQWEDQFLDIEKHGSPYFYKGAPSAIVNYTWINDEVFSVSDDRRAPLCGIPLNYIERAIANAQKYPDATFNIWIDRRYLEDTPSEFLLQSFLFASDCPNVKIRDLNEISDYAKADLFDPSSGVSIWHRADLARILTVRHTLQENPARTSIYADFDIEDIKLNDAKLINSFKKAGLVLGTVTPDCYRFENGFFGFDHRHIDNGFLPHLIEKAHAAVDNYDKRNAIYGSYVTTLTRYFNATGLSERDHFISVLEKCDYKIPHNAAFNGISIQPGW